VKLLETHRSWLRAAIRVRLRDNHEVDEVLQETAREALKGIEQLRDENAAAPWLYKIAIRQALRYRRRMGQQRKLVEKKKEEISEEINVAPDPLTWLLAEEKAEQIRQSFDELPRRDAEILLLKYSQDWNYQQISQHLGLSQSAVEARLHRARSRLRKKLAARQIVPVTS